MQVLDQIFEEQRAGCGCLETVPRWDFEFVSTTHDHHNVALRLLSSFCIGTNSSHLYHHFHIMVCLQFWSRMPWPRQSRALFLCTILLLLQPAPTNAIKFTLQAYRYPPQKCIWNPAHPDALVIVTANVGPGAGQRVDVEIMDSSPQKNKYLSKRGINGETRLAVTTHADGEVGVCFRNYLDNCEVFARFLHLLCPDLNAIIASCPFGGSKNIVTYY